MLKVVLRQITTSQWGPTEQGSGRGSLVQGLVREGGRTLGQQEKGLWGWGAGGTASVTGSLQRPPAASAEHRAWRRLLARRL